MKKLLIVALLIVVMCPINAQKKQDVKLTRQEQKFKKILDEYDVIDYLPYYSDEEGETFWNAIVDNNEEFQKFLKMIPESKGWKKEIFQEVYRGNKLSYNEQIPYARSFKDIDWMEMFFKSHYGNINIHYSTLDYVNASTLPLGDVFVYSGLVDILEHYEEMVAVLAHEFAHFMYQHSMQWAYSCEKQKRKNKTIATITAVVSAAADMYATMNGANTTGSSEANSKYYDSIFESAKNKSLKYQFRYSKDQELQADIIAYRFLDWMGMGHENMIVVLEKLRKQNPMADYEDEEKADHPLLKNRIALLKFIEKYDSMKQNQK